MLQPPFNHLNVIQNDRGFFDGNEFLDGPIPGSRTVRIG